MAKTQEATTVDPLSAFGFQRPVLANGDHGVLVASKLNNWIAGFRQECHLSCAAGPADWDGRDAPPALNIVASGTLDRPVSTDMWFNADEASWLATFGMEWIVPATMPITEVEVTLTLIGGVGTLTWTTSIFNADSGLEVLDNTLDLSTVTDGDEWVWMQLEVEQLSGAGVCPCNELNFEVNERTSLPDPENS